MKELEIIYEDKDVLVIRKVRLQLQLPVLASHFPVPLLLQSQTEK